jgi:heptosyltransferase III
LGAWLREQPSHVHDVTGTTSLAELLALIDASDGFIAASTGPLHCAAALGVPTLGLFSPRRPIHPGRWAPIGARAELLVGTPGADARAELASIPVQDVVGRVLAWEAQRVGAHGSSIRKGSIG